SCAEQRGPQPFIREAKLLRPLARRDDERRHRPRALVVALALPLPVQSRQIAGAVVLVQVELHAAFVGFDGLAEVAALVKSRLRRPPSSPRRSGVGPDRAMSSSSFAIASIRFPALDSAKAF